MKKFFILGISALPFLFTSCGGGEAGGETTDSDSTATEVEAPTTEYQSYAVDTAGTIIHWMSYEGEEVSHAGTIKALEGTFEVATTGEDIMISNASMIIDMNSISEESEKLVGHLMAEDFFDVNQFATTEFVFDRHEEGMVYGTVSITGKEVAVAAPATVSADANGATVEVGDFQIDMSSLEMPFFTREREEAPEEEWHDSNIGFKATVKGMKL